MRRCRQLKCFRRNAIDVVDVVANRQNIRGGQNGSVTNLAALDVMNPVTPRTFKIESWSRRVFTCINGTSCRPTISYTRPIKSVGYSVAAECVSFVIVNVDELSFAAGWILLTRSHCVRVRMGVWKRERERMNTNTVLSMFKQPAYLPTEILWSSFVGGNTTNC